MSTTHNPQSEAAQSALPAASADATPLKMVYFHGFASSGATGTAELLRKLLPSATVVAPDIPVDPDEALPYLRLFCADEQPDVIVGTSMGAMYAQQMRGFVRVCVNPAFNMSTMSKTLHTGTFKFHNGRRDHQKEFRITAEIIKHFNMMERHQFEGITPEERERCYGLFGNNDKTVNPINAYNTFTKYYVHAERFEGEHQLNERSVRHALLPLLKRIFGARYEASAREPLPDYMKY